MDSARNFYIGLDPLPVVTLPPREAYRGEMIVTLGAVDRRWHISSTSSSLSDLRSVIADGMGIDLLPLCAVSIGYAVLPKNTGPPVVDVFKVVLLHWPAADPTVKAPARMLSRALMEDARSRPAFEK